MPISTNTVVLGAVAPHLIDILAMAGRGTPRYALRTGRSAQTPAPAQVETVLLPAGALDMPLLDEDLQPVFRWIERICRDPGLSEIDNSAVPTALRLFAECNLAGICARRGCAVTVILGRKCREVGRDESRAAEAHLATLAVGRVDLVYVSPTPTTPTIGRAVVHRPLQPQILARLNDAGLNALDAIFASVGAIVDATGLSPRQAVALQLRTAEEAMRCRAAVWPGVESALDARLADQVGALRRQKSSDAARRSPPPAPCNDGPPSALTAALAGPSDLESIDVRPPRLGEAVALVPIFDAVNGRSGVIQMQPRLADALRLPARATLQPGRLAASSRRVSRRPWLLAKILAWRADRR